jgi:hypothetical protein
VAAPPDGRWVAPLSGAFKPRFDVPSAVPDVAADTEADRAQATVPPLVDRADWDLQVGGHLSDRPEAIMFHPLSRSPSFKVSSGLA